MLKRISDLDVDFLLSINKLSIEQYDAFWLYVTNPWIWIPLFLFLSYLIYTQYSGSDLIMIFITIMLTVFLTISLTELTKNVCLRIRPNNATDLSHVLRILKNPEGYSFFSGHASSSMAISTFIILLLRRKTKTKWIYLLYIWPILFSFSRLYLAVHYPSDIMTGMLVGSLIGFIAYYIISYHLLRY